MLTRYYTRPSAVDSSFEVMHCHSKVPLVIDSTEPQAQEIARLLTEAYVEGIEAGEDNNDEAFADGYDEGYEAGKADAKCEADEADSKLEAITEKGAYDA